MYKLLPVLLIGALLGGEVQAQCNAAFTSNIYGANAQFRVNDSSAGKIHHWYFGDGTQGGGHLAYHSYSLPGTYVVKHIITDSLNSCTDTARQTITINFPVGCSSSFIISRDSSSSHAYRFTSTSSATGGTITYYKWTLNGDSVSNLNSFDTSLAQGKHYICLTIITSTGCISNTCDSVRIDTNVNCNLSAYFIASPSGNNPLQITFSPFPTDTALSYSWTFGDGQSSNLKTPVHTYASAGSFVVTLFVTDSTTGCKDSISQYIFVRGIPVDSCTASFTYTINPSNPNQYSFTATSNRNILSQRWQITPCDSSLMHDSVVYNTPNPVHTFTKAGCYRVCVTLVTDSNCIRTYCETLIVQTDSSLLRKQASRISSFPNPTYSTPVTISLDLLQREQVKIAVYNTNGNLVYSNEKGYGAGNNRINIPAEKLQRGMYYVDIRYGNNRKQSTFQKL